MLTASTPHLKACHMTTNAFKWSCMKGSAPETCDMLRVAILHKLSYILIFVPLYNVIRMKDT